MTSTLRRSLRRIPQLLGIAAFVCAATTATATQHPRAATAATGDIRPLDDLSSPSTAGEPYISDDGSTIIRSVYRQTATAYYEDIYRMDVASGTSTLIMAEARLLWASPDGGSIIARQPYYSHMYRVDALTGAILEQLPPVHNYWGITDISGDGNQMAYVSYVNDSTRHQLFVMDLTTGVSTQLTTDAGYIHSAQLNHDGSRVYSDVQDLPGVSVSTTGPTAVMLDRPSGQFTALNPVGYTGGTTIGQLTPDERYVTVSDWDSRSWRVDLDTGEFINLAIANNGSPLYVRSLDISRDGRFVALETAWYGEPSRIMVRDLALPTPTLYSLPHGDALSRVVRFSPDATQVYVQGSPSRLGFGHSNTPNHWFVVDFDGPTRGVEAVEVVAGVYPAYGPFGLAWRATPSVIHWRAQLLDGSPVTTPATITVDQPGLHTFTSEQSCPTSGASTAACGVGTTVVGYDPDPPVVNTVGPFPDPYPDAGDPPPWATHTPFLEVIDALSGTGVVRDATLDGEVCVYSNSSIAAPCNQWGGYGGTNSALFTTESPLADGVHTFTANASDRVGNTVAISTTFRVGPPPAETDLALAFTSDLPTMTSGDVMRWTARVHNQANDYAGPFTVTMNVPAGMEAVPHSVAPHGTIDAGVVTFTIDELAPANSIDLGMDTVISDVSYTSFRGWAELSTMSQSDRDSTPDAVDGNDAYVARGQLDDALLDVPGDEDDHDDATVEISLTPSIAVELSSASVDFDALGQTVDWQATMTNTGDAFVTDLQLASVSGDPFTCDSTTLAVGASTMCQSSHPVTQLDLDSGGIFESVNATALASNGVAVGANSDLAFVGAVQTPAITVDAVANPASVVRAGEVMTFTSTVTNTGNITLIAPMVTATAVTMTCPLAPDETLAPGSSVTCSGSRAATSGDFVTGTVTNNVSVVADGVNGVSATASASASVTARHTAPSAPLNVTATGGNASLTVRWARSADDGGSTILGYRAARSIVRQGLASLSPPADSPRRRL